jgi:putative ABC transport system ATP-binding protein
MTTAPLVCHDVAKSYALPDGRLRDVLQGIEFALPPGEAVALVGRSGSGKSTLLHLAAGIDIPTRGRVLLAGHDLGTLAERERTLLRRRHVGLVFQFFHLLPHLSVLDNVALPGWVAGLPNVEARRRAADLLDRVGMADHGEDRAGRLSGGEMQRVALCRALLARPPLVLADEPTGNLDDENGRLVMDLLLRIVREEGASLLFVTHSVEQAALADRIWHLHSGVLERDDAGAVGKRAT